MPPVRRSAEERSKQLGITAEYQMQDRVGAGVASVQAQPGLRATHAVVADDAELIGRSQTGDVESFNRLVERYQQRLYAVCYRMLGDHDEAADALQESLLAAYCNIRRYHGGSFIAWLLRIATNKSLDHLRGRTRRSSVSLDRGAAVDAAPFHISDPSESPDQRLLRLELARSLERKLQQLPADQRMVIILSDIQGHSHEEIIAITGWPAGTVKSRLSRGRARLRDALRSTDFSSQE